MPERTSNLKPLKALIYGPPASGKTKAAERLCRHYGAHYVSVKSMIDETLQELQDTVDKAKLKISQQQMKKSKHREIEGEAGEDVREEELEEEEIGDGGVPADIEDCQEQIKFITNSLERSLNHKLPDALIIRLMRSFLLKEVCQTRGFILDGFPKTVEQATDLFGQTNGDIGEGILKEESAITGEGGPHHQVPDMVIEASLLIMPDFVVSLEAPDEFLCERVMKLPQKLVHGTHFDEVGMLRRLAEFHENNQEDYSVLKFFDNIGINPIVIHIFEESTLEELNFDDVYNIICTYFGEPIPGFGLTPEEEDAIRKLEMEQRRLLEEEERLERELMEKKAKKEYEEKMEKWNETLEKLQLEEEKVLAAQSETLRFYLMKYIFPTLSKGLVEVAKVKPEDPVDFLAEYLFKENPEGKMFDPSYTRQGERILQQYEEEVKPTVDQAEQIQ